MEQVINSIKSKVKIFVLFKKKNVNLTYSFSKTICHRYFFLRCYFKWLSNIFTKIHF